MKDLNHVVLVGRCTRDTTMKYTVGGMAIGSFSIAVNRSVKKGDGWADEASFFDCVLYGKIAESVDRYLVKGKQVAVEGELHQKRWEQSANPSIPQQQQNYGYAAPVGQSQYQYGQNQYQSNAEAERLALAAKEAEYKAMAEKKLRDDEARKRAAMITKKKSVTGL